MKSKTHDLLDKIGVPGGFKESERLELLRQNIIGTLVAVAASYGLHRFDADDIWQSLIEARGVALKRVKNPSLSQRRAKR